MATILAIMIILAAGWVTFLVFIAPILIAGKAVQLVIQEKREDKIE